MINNKLINNKIKEGTTIFYDYDEKKKVFSYYSRRVRQTITVKLSDMHLKLITSGNAKTGPEYLLNTLPGDNFIPVKGQAVTNLQGSCKNCCDGCEHFCYAIKGAKRFHNSIIPNNGMNLILYREDRERFLQELREWLNSWKEEVKVFRWHASGEIDSPQYLEDMMQIASEYPDIHFYSYTKRFEWIKQYLDTHGGVFPKNFTWNLSVWKDNLEKSNFPKEYLKQVQLFVWDDLDDPTLESLPHCPSVEYKPGDTKGHLNHKPLPNGKARNCKNCGLCWKGFMKGKAIAVYNH